MSHFIEGDGEGKGGAERRARSDYRYAANLFDDEEALVFYFRKASHKFAALPRLIRYAAETCDADGYFDASMERLVEAVGCRRPTWTPPCSTSPGSTSSGRARRVRAGRRCGSSWAG
jgi:hypothetical protein